MKFRKILLFLCIFVLIIPANASAALPSGARTNIDSTFKMTTGYQWNFSQNYPTLMYRVNHPSMNRSDYMYEMNWYTSVNGSRTSKNVILMRPRGAGDLGRTFVHPNDLSWWAGQLNGNSSYVQSQGSMNSINISNVYDGHSGRRVYTRDLAKWTGANIQQIGTGQYDGPPNQGNGHQMSEVSFRTTQYPTGYITAPSSASAGQSVSVSMNGVEYYPHSVHGTSPVIKYELRLDGQVINSGTAYSSSMNRNFTISNGICTSGTRQLSLKLTDIVERSTTVTKSISISGSCGGTTPPPVTPPYEPPPVTPPPTTPDPVTPPVIIGGSCPNFSEPFPASYEHEIDLELTRVDARTVDANTLTNTDVYVKRENFFTNRQNALADFDLHITKANTAKTQCETLILTWQNAISGNQIAKSTCVRENRPNCYVYDNAIAEYNSKIASARTAITGYNYIIDLANAEKKKINDATAANQTITARVDLSYEGWNVSTLDIPIREGETIRKTMPRWGPYNKPYDVIAEVNRNGPYKEFKYTDRTRKSKVSLGYNQELGSLLYPNANSNNWLDTKQHVATYAMAACERVPEGKSVQSESFVSGVVRTVNEKGDRKEYTETLYSTYYKEPALSIRAGQGFSYGIESYYDSEEVFYKLPEPSIPKNTIYSESYFPTLSSHLPYERGGATPAFDEYGKPIPADGVDEGYRVPMDTVDKSETGGVGTEGFYSYHNFELPEVAVEEYSGNVFLVNNNDHLTHVERNLNDSIMTEDENGNPLREWYTPFDHPDGDYEYHVRIYNQGINHLSTCHSMKTEIDGSIIGDPEGNDDFIKRAVTPENPFPSGTGWNWSGEQGKLIGLKDWYMNWYQTPGQIPAASYEKRFMLTQDKVKEIKKFNKENPDIKLGDSIFQEINGLSQN